MLYAARSSCSAGRHNPLQGRPVMPAVWSQALSAPPLDRDVLTAGRIEWPPVPAAVTVSEAKPGLAGHQVQFARPAVADGYRPQVNTVPVQRDDLGGDTLLHGIMTRKLEDRGILCHRQCLDSLARSKGQVRDEAFDDEHPVWVEDLRHVLEALGLACLAEQAEQRVGDQIHQPERTADPDLRHVADGDRDRFSARLGPQPPDHRLRSVNSLHDHATARQGQRYPAGPDRQFQHSSAVRQLGEEVHRRLRVKTAIAVVINTRPAGAIESRIIKPSHAVTKAEAGGRRYTIFTAESPAATYSSAAADECSAILVVVPTGHIRCRTGGPEQALIVHDADERSGWSVPVTFIFLVRQSVLLRKRESLEPVQPSARTYSHHSVRGDDGDGTACGLLEKFDPT